MTTEAYRQWVRDGRRFRRPPWLVELKALARVHGVPFLGDLGSDDESHLQNDFPQDHCPFSFTEWPVQIREYVINAIDLGKGPHAYRIIDAARNGRAPWVKYVNVEHRQYHVKNNWEPVRNSDDHCHVSGRTDHTWTGLGGFNPFIEQTATATPAPIIGEDEDMEFIYASNRGWTVFNHDGRLATVTSQAEANAISKALGKNANTLTSTEYDVVIGVLRNLSAPTNETA